VIMPEAKRSRAASYDPQFKPLSFGELFLHSFTRIVPRILRHREPFLLRFREHNAKDAKQRPSLTPGDLPSGFFGK
jgi:hypothetical protein